MKIARPFWLNRIKAAWLEASLVWLAGVRRSGKTTLAKSIPKALYLNCDLPSVVDRLEDPEQFFRNLREPVVIFDEVHQLADPSRLLKIGTDEFPRIKILATGSSTLAATDKFKDTLAGRKRVVHLTPVLFSELDSFEIGNLDERLHRGGLPPALLTEEYSGEFYREWLDSFYARDIQELFRVEKRQQFLRLFELLLRQSGGACEATNLSRVTELSRQTVLNYLSILEITHAIHLIRPFHGGRPQEISAQPKVYGFDTGFVAFARGWGEIRAEDRGLLWEHLVLDELRAHSPTQPVFYWRNKQKQEVDFVLPQGRKEVLAIECKSSSKNLDLSGLKAFRDLHPKGKNILIYPGKASSVVKHFGSLEVTVTTLDEFLRKSGAKGNSGTSAPRS